MESLIDAKDKELKNRLKDISFCKNALLGVLGMARTCNVIKILSKDEKLVKMKQFQEAVLKIADNLLDGKHNDIRSYCQICNELIIYDGYIPEYDLSQKEENLFGLLHMVLENWFYFLQDDFEGSRSGTGSDFRMFILFPAEILQEYLSTENDSIPIKGGERQKIINENENLCNEIDRVESDIQLIMCGHWNAQDIYRRIDEYINLDIIN